METVSLVFNSGSGSMNSEKNGREEGSDVAAAGG